MKFLLIILSLSLYNISWAQSVLSPQDVIYTFFQAMEDIDTLRLRDLMDSEATLSTSYTSKDGHAVYSTTRQQFIESVATAEVGSLDEQISNLHVQSDDGLASVWMDYSFYYQGELSHCGVNVFTLAKVKDEWKIISIADTRRKDGCTSVEAKQSIDKMIDLWHLSATDADSTAYFDLMTTNSIYVGTDASEVWSKRKFLSFAAPYFAKGKAWAFTKVSRNIYSNDFEEIAWFDEVLDTWMGPCRGSGVVMKDDAGLWKIQHYVLSVAVANDDIKQYLEILKKK